MIIYKRWVMNSKIYASDQLVAYVNKAALKQALLIVPPMVLAFGLWFWLIFGVEKLIGYYMRVLIQCAIACPIVILLFGFVYSCLVIHDKSPVVIFSSEGVWTAYHGYIVWQDICWFGLYRSDGIPYIAIRVRDVTKLSKQSTLGGKVRIFVAKTFGNPPIMLSNLTLSNEQIISFAAQWYPKNSYENFSHPEKLN